MKHLYTIILLSVMLSSCCSNGSSSLPRAKADKAFAAAFDNYVAAVDSLNEGIYSIMVVRHGKVIAEKWFGDYTPDSVFPMNSVSKTFTSMAVGLLVEKGLISTDQKVVDLFPEKVPAEPSDRLMQMSVHNLLTMNSGHPSDPTARIRDDKQIPPEENDWIARFMEGPFDYAPGEYFCYNSLCTYLLSAAVQKLTGEKVVDFLTPRLFDPLGIEKPEWDESPAGINCGGWGLRLKTEDMAKLGQLILDGGVWKGRRLIPADWISKATAKQVDSRPAGTTPETVVQRGLTTENSDWLQGYGYQMWMCRHNAFRADGARGQLVLVIPEKDAVIAVTARVTHGMQHEVDMIWDYLLPALGTKSAFLGRR